MDINDAARELDERIRKAREFANYSDDIKDVMGVEAQQFYRESFKNQGFTDDNLKPWADVKRRDPNSPQYGKGARATALILTNTEELKDAIYFSRTEKGVRVYNEKVYARVHNFGGKAGKNSFQMIARQFIGPSKIMMQNIKAEMKTRINAILKGK